MSLATLQALVRAFDVQIDWCTRLDSPMYVTLLAAARSDLLAGGSTARVFEGYELDPVRSAAALRFMGAVHRLVLTGAAPGLARFYPSAGGAPGDGMVGAFLDVVERHVADLRTWIAVPPQTNEVGRSAVLALGLAAATVDIGMPVELLEIGSSAGLNLLLDRYGYRFAGHAWGDDTSTLILEPEWKGDRPLLGPSIAVVSRRGCDVDPIDLRDESQRVALLSYAWPDQPGRFDRLAEAAVIAVSEDVVVERSDAVSWLEDVLAERPSAGIVSVVQHSVMWQYLADDDRVAVDDLIADAGARADSSCPLVRVSFEPDKIENGVMSFALVVTVWPGGEPRVLAHAHPHGSWIAWHPDDVVPTDILAT